MFKLRVADYINTNMIERGLTYKDLARMSGVADSSIHTYVQAKVGNPSEDNLIRIAAAFGDPPEIIQQMRRESAESSAKENKIIAESSDQERMEQFAELMCSSMAAILAENNANESARQTEIIQHSDAHVETERRRFKERAEEVLRQCNEENDRIRKACDHEIQLLKDFNTQQLKMLTEFYEARLEDQRRHMEQLAAKDDKLGGELRSKNERSIEYLQSSVRNLVGSCILLAMTTLFFGAYAIFSYTVFDMADPMRGLHRGGHSIGPVVLAVSAILIAVAGSRIIILFLNRPKKKEKNDQ